MIGRTVGDVAVGIDLEEADFSAAAFVTVANDRDSVFRYEHLVVPGIVRIDVWPKGINRRNWTQRAITDCDREQPPASQNYELIAMHLHDAAFIDAGVLDVGDGFLFVIP